MWRNRGVKSATPRTAVSGAADSHAHLAHQHLEHVALGA